MKRRRGIYHLGKDASMGVTIGDGKIYIDVSVDEVEEVLEPLPAFTESGKFEITRQDAENLISILSEGLSKNTAKEEGGG